MMKLYCMCHQKNDKPESQAFGARNLYAPCDKETDFRTVVLTWPMKIKRSGVKQVLLYPRDKDIMNDWTDNAIIKPGEIWKQHYPNVDMFECPICGAKICRE